MAKKDDGSRVRDALRVGGELPDPGSAPVGPGKKPKALAKLDSAGERLSALQEALYAEGVGGGQRSVLLVLQGMDTSGKGGTVSHVLGLVNPMGVRYAGFKAPTPAERRHHYLWRIRKQLPVPGQIGVFDRSHYEDILVPRVSGLLTAAERRRRYSEINAFEKELADAGTTVVKVFLHISPEEQLKRLKARLETPEKQLEVQPGRPRSALALAGLPGGLRRHLQEDVDGPRAVARRARRPQVVPQLGRRRAAHRNPRGAGPRSSRSRTSTSPRSWRS